MEQVSDNFPVVIGSDEICPPKQRWGWMLIRSRGTGMGLGVWGWGVEMGGLSGNG